MKYDGIVVSWQLYIQWVGLSGMIKVHDLLLYAITWAAQYWIFTENWTDILEIKIWNGTYLYLWIFISTKICLQRAEENCSEQDFHCKIRFIWSASVSYI